MDTIRGFLGSLWASEVIATHILKYTGMSSDDSAFSSCGQVVDEFDNVEIKVQRH